MTKREFVERAAMRIYAATIASGEYRASEDDARTAVTEALGIWNEIEKQVPPELSPFAAALSRDITPR